MEEGAIEEKYKKGEKEEKDRRSYWTNLRKQNDNRR
jgi:hypothetical protein